MRILYGTKSNTFKIITASQDRLCAWDRQVLISRTEPCIEPDDLCLTKSQFIFGMVITSKKTILSRNKNRFYLTRPISHKMLLITTSYIPIFQLLTNWILKCEQDFNRWTHFKSFTFEQPYEKGSSEGVLLCTVRNLSHITLYSQIDWLLGLISIKPHRSLYYFWIWDQAFSAPFEELEYLLKCFIFSRSCKLLVFLFTGSTRLPFFALEKEEWSSAGYLHVNILSGN